VNLM